MDDYSQLTARLTARLLPSPTAAIRVKESRFVPAFAPTRARSVIGYIDSVTAYLDPTPTTPLQRGRTPDKLGPRAPYVPPVPRSVPTRHGRPHQRTPWGVLEWVDAFLDDRASLDSVPTHTVRITDGPLNPAYVDRLIAELRRLLTVRATLSGRATATYSRGIREHLRLLLGAGVTLDAIVDATSDLL